MRADEPTSRPSAAAAACAAVLLALFASRLWVASTQAVWIDEAFSLYYARHPLSMLWTRGWELESSPPLHYTLMWLWTRLVGDGEWLARVLSILLFTAATAFVHAGARALGGWRAGAVAAIAFAAHPLVFEYSLEIRPYALKLLLVSIAVWGLCRALAAHEARRIARTRDALVLASPLIIGTVLLVYTHATAAAFVVAISLATALYGVLARAGRRFAALWLIANAATLLAVLPQLSVMLGVLGTNSTGLSWIPPPTDIGWLRYVGQSLLAGRHHVATTPWLPWLVMLVYVVAIWRLRARPAALAVGFVLPALGVAVLIALSFVHPIVLPRTVLWTTVPASVGIGCALATYRLRSPVAWFALATLAVMLVTVVGNLRVRETQRWWPSAIAEQAQRMQPGDEVAVIDPEVMCVVDYYARPPLADARRWMLIERDATFRPPQRIDLECNRPPKLAPTRIVERVMQGAGLWVLAGDQRQRREVEALLVNLGDALRVTDRIDREGVTVAWRLATP